jgi:AcrR family transcriptional regulator
MATEIDSSAQPRVPLNRDRVLHAALDLAHEDGVESLTMRKLGQVLGVEAMSLYNHVANKDDILDGIIDLVLTEIELPSAAGDWDTAVRRSAISVHDALRRQPWACSLMMSPARVRPARLRYMDSLLGRLREAGFSAETTYHAYHALDGHIFGFSLWQTSHSLTAADLPDLAARFLRKFPLDEYPHLAEHVEQHLTEGRHHDVSAFEFGLDLILDGLKKIRGTA